jgi:hypothetical protein
MTAWAWHVEARMLRQGRKYGLSTKSRHYRLRKKPVMLRFASEMTSKRTQSRERRRIRVLMSSSINPKTRHGNGSRVPMASRKRNALQAKSCD